MTVVNTKATVVTNQDRETVSGLPNLLNPLFLYKGAVKTQTALVALGASESNNSTYRVGRVRSSDRIKAIGIISDAMAGLTAVDVGLYDTAANGGAVVSQHLFVTGLDIHLGLTTPSNVRWTNLLAASAEQRVWEMLSLASDPNKEYDVVLTATTRGSATGNIAVDTDVVDGLA